MVGKVVPLTQCYDFAKQHPRGSVRDLIAAFVVMGCLAWVGWVTALHPWLYPPPPVIPPVIFLSAELLTPSVPRGGVLRFLARARAGQPNQVCGGMIKREFHRRVTMPNGIAVWEKWRPEAAPAPIYLRGEDTNEPYIIALPLDPHYPAGSWRFLGETVNICGMRGEDRVVVKAGPFNFEITESAP